jgi:hypothetical protein
MILFYRDGAGLHGDEPRIRSRSLKREKLAIFKRKLVLGHQIETPRQ